MCLFIYKNCFFLKKKINFPYKRKRYNFVNIKKTILCTLLVLASFPSQSYEDGFGLLEEKNTTDARDPSFGYVGFGLSYVNGTFDLCRSTASQFSGETVVEPNPITLKPIPNKDDTGVGALMFSAHFGFMSALPNPLFTAGLFGGFNWSSLSQKWDTSAHTPENSYNAVIDRPESTASLASALHVPLSIEAGGHLGVWAHSRCVPFVRVGWSLMRGGVNRTGWVDRYRYTYFNGVIIGGGVDFMMTKQSSLSLSYDWVGYGSRLIRNFDTKKNAELKEGNEPPAQYNYQTMLQSYVKPSYTRLMVSIKYVLPNNDHYDML